LAVIGVEVKMENKAGLPFIKSINENEQHIFNNCLL